MDGGRTMNRRQPGGAQHDYTLFNADPRGLARLRTASERNEKLRLVSRILASWNQLDGWLRQIEGLRRAA